MKRRPGALWIMIPVIVLGFPAAAFAYTLPPDRACSPGLGPGARMDDLPARPPSGFARADTLDFGYFTTIDGQDYAVLGERWTWDHGSADLFEGWYGEDRTEHIAADVFRQITAADWYGHGNGVAAPIINGLGSVWCGIFEDQARSLCWEAGLGYGNNWCQRLTSREYTWTGGGNVTLSFTYFNNSEHDWDYSKVLLSTGPSPVSLNGDGFTDVIGTPPAGPWATFTHVITPAELGVPVNSPFRIYFEFDSDGGWSDEDGDYTTTYGPFGLDDLTLSGAVSGGPYTYDFESGLGADWTPGRCPGIGSYFAIRALSGYALQDPCQCRLSGNVATFHDANLRHPDDQDEAAWSPPVDRTNYPGYNKILAEWDQYADLGFLTGTFYRPGWAYYPYLCPSTGESVWSHRVGDTVWHYTSGLPLCGAATNVATDWGVPSDCQLVRFAYEIYESCWIDPLPPATQCIGSAASNFSPVIDNVRIRMTTVPQTPVASLDPGDKFQDGFPQTDVLGVTSTGNAKVGRPRNIWPNPDNDPWRLGDSLVVAGPTVTPSRRWEAKLWFRIRREGPGQVHVAGYRTWKGRVADGREIAGPAGAFTWAFMDSVELGTQVYKNKFASYFKENDDDYTPGAPPKPDIGPQNKIIMDGILTPGTKIEYFCTTNYTCLPSTYFFLPDTTGGAAYEFEILPSYRSEIENPVPPGYGPYKFPCILYVDAFDRGVQTWMEGALNMALNGASTGEALKIPDPTKWDRYDYNDASSTFHAPLFRNPGGDNGATVAELLGYRMMIVNTGTFPPGACHPQDWLGFQDWLGNPACGGNTAAQGFWANGDQIAGIIQEDGPTFLGAVCGTSLVCRPYHSPGCVNPEDVNYCVRLEPSWDDCPGIDLWGNWCPEQFGFSMLGTDAGGVGAQGFRRIGGGLTNYASVRTDRLGNPGRYRTQVDGYSIDHLIRRSGDDPQGECLFDTTRTLEAVRCEVNDVLRFGLGLPGGYDLTTLGLTGDPCLDPLAAPEAMGAAAPVNRLEQNRPNPFNPVTTIRFSLAQAGPARVSIYDVDGRLVRILVDGPLPAGPHEAAWDGLDQSGRRVPAGIYWSRLRAGAFMSNRKMLVVR